MKKMRVRHWTMGVAERPLGPGKEALGSMARRRPPGLRVRTWAPFDLGSYLVSSMGEKFQPVCDGA